MLWFIQSFREHITRVAVVQPINRPFPTQRLVNRFLNRPFTMIFVRVRVQAGHDITDLNRFADEAISSMLEYARALVILITDHCLNNSMRWKCISAHRSDRSMCYFSLHVYSAARAIRAARHSLSYTSIVNGLQLKQLAHCLSDEIRTKKRKSHKLFSISTCSRKLRHRNSSPA